MNLLPPSTNPRRRRRISVRGVILALAALLCLAAVWVVVQWQRRPAYWQRHDQFMQMPAAEVTALADQLESRMVRQVSQTGRNGDTTTIVIGFDEANAWLMMNLGAWARHQQISIPEPLSDMMVALEGGRPVIGFALATPEVEQVFSIAFDVRMLASGQAAIQIAGVRAGRLPIPISAVLEHLRKSVPPEILDPVEQLVAGDPFDPVTPHPGHAAKQLRLVGFEVTSQGVALTLKAEAR